MLYPLKSYSSGQSLTSQPSFFSFITLLTHTYLTYLDTDDKPAKDLSFEYYGVKLPVVAGEEKKGTVGDKEALDGAIEKGRGSVLRWEGGGENVEWSGIKVRIRSHCFFFLGGRDVSL
jgi:hypothetical protein